jgi:hypothetical protein
MNHIQYFSLIFLILKGNDFICIGLVLTESKNYYFTKIGGTKKVHGTISRCTSQLLTLKIFFQSSNLLKVWIFLESLHRNLSVVVPMENVMLKIENIIVYRS